MTTITTNPFRIIIAVMALALAATACSSSSDIALDSGSDAATESSPETTVPTRGGVEAAPVADLSDESDSTPDVVDGPDQDDDEEEAAFDEGSEDDSGEPEPSTAPEPQPDPTPAPESDSTPGPQPTPQPQPDPTPGPQPDPTPGPQPTPQPQPDPTPGPQPTPQPQPDPTPEPQPTPQPDPTPEPQPTPAPTPEPQPTPPEAPTCLGNPYYSARDENCSRAQYRNPPHAGRLLAQLEALYGSRSKARVVNDCLAAGGLPYYNQDAPGGSKTSCTTNGAANYQPLGSSDGNARLLPFPDYNPTIGSADTPIECAWIGTQAIINGAANLTQGRPTLNANILSTFYPPYSNCR